MTYLFIKIKEWPISLVYLQSCVVCGDDMLQNWHIFYCCDWMHILCTDISMKMKAPSIIPNICSLLIILQNTVLICGTFY